MWFWKSATLARAMPTLNVWIVQTVAQSLCLSLSLVLTAGKLVNVTLAWRSTLLVCLCVCSRVECPFCSYIFSLSFRPCESHFGVPVIRFLLFSYVCVRARSRLAVVVCITIKTSALNFLHVHILSKQDKFRTGMAWEKDLIVKALKTTVTECSLSHDRQRRLKIESFIQGPLVL